MKQFLLNPDGSLPTGADEALLRSAGVVLVIPTDVPREPGMVAVEQPAEQREDGNWYQVWSLAPAPVPEE